MIRFVPKAPVIEKSAADKMMDDALESDEMRLMNKIERESASIANLMTSIHGGAWRSRVDHQRKMVLIWMDDAE